AGILCMISKRVCQIESGGHGHVHAQWQETHRLDFVCCRQVHADLTAKQALDTTHTADVCQQLDLQAEVCKRTYSPGWNNCLILIILLGPFNIMNDVYGSCLWMVGNPPHCCRQGRPRCRKSLTRLMLPSVPKIISDCIKQRQTCYRGGLLTYTMLPREWSDAFLTLLPKPGGVGGILVASSNGTTICLPPQEHSSLSCTVGSFYRWTFPRPSIKWIGRACFRDFQKCKYLLTSLHS
ncbi:unnamed protein product, partial [Cladocopium goreaui]